MCRQYSGRSQLTATTLTSPDIRAGMALMGAALCASGKSRLQNSNMIEPGCERIEARLQSVLRPACSLSYSLLEPR